MEVGVRMSTLIGRDRKGELVEIGDVVMVFGIQNYEEIPFEMAVIVDFLYPFVDPVEVCFSCGQIVHRKSIEIEKVSDEKAMLWKLVYA
jgi:hypothetical protein